MYSKMIALFVFAAVFAVASAGPKPGLAPLAYTASAAPLAYTSPVAYTAAGPVAYTAAGPVAYTAAGPLAYTAAGPVAYTAAGPVAYTAPALAYSAPVASSSQVVHRTYNRFAAPLVAAPAYVL